MIQMRQWQVIAVRKRCFILLGVMKFLIYVPQKKQRRISAEIEDRNVERALGQK